MTHISISIFLLINALANRIRGGALDDYFNIKGNTLIRVVSALMVAISIPILFNVYSIYYFVIGAYVGIAWFIFNLFSWGLWHDMSNDTAKLEYVYMRKVSPNFLKTLYLKLIMKTTLSPIQMKLILMYVRGLFLIVFTPLLVYMNPTPFQLLFPLVGAFLWVSAYYVGRNYLDKYSHDWTTELLAGIAIGIFLLMGVSI